MIFPAYIWNEERERIYQWIKNDLQLPIYAEAYKGSVYVLWNKIPGYISFVSHACRDILNGLASDYKGIKRKQVQYLELVSGISKDWNLGWGRKASIINEELPEYINIPSAICERMNHLIKEHDEGKIRSEESKYIFFQTFFEYRDKDKIPSQIIKEWKESMTWFQKHAHSRKKDYENSIDEELKKRFLDYERTLLTAADSLTNRLKEIDAILEETN